MSIGFLKDCLQQKTIGKPFKEKLYDYFTLEKLSKLLLLLMQFILIIGAILEFSVLYLNIIYYGFYILSYLLLFITLMSLIFLWRKIIKQSVNIRNNSLTSLEKFIFIELLCCISVLITFGLICGLFRNIYPADRHILGRIGEIGFGATSLITSFLIIITSFFLVFYSTYMYIIIYKTDKLKNIYKVYQLKFCRFTILISISLFFLSFYHLIMALLLTVANDLFSQVTWFLVNIIWVLLCIPYHILIMNILYEEKNIVLILAKISLFLFKKNYFINFNSNMICIYFYKKMKGSLQRFFNFIKSYNKSL